MKPAAQWISLAASAAIPIITFAQIETAPCASCATEEPVETQSGSHCELETLDGGIVSVSTMLRTAYLCGNEPELCRGFFEEVIGGSSWRISWCPMFEAGVGLRFDPVPPNPARSSFMISGVAWADTTGGAPRPPAGA